MGMKMNPVVKEKWTAALRSGEYAQTKSTLHDQAGYCCLGVLCDVAVKEGLDLDVIESEHDGRWRYNGEDIELPTSVAEWAGLEDEDDGYTPATDPFAGGNLLSSVNDSGTPFTLIADLIEEHL